MTQTGFMAAMSWLRSVLPERQDDTEHGPTGPAVVLDQAAVMLDIGLRKRKAESGSPFAAGHQGMEHSVPDFRWDARAAVDHLQF
jgi:hypothetical protein